MLRVTTASGKFWKWLQRRIEHSRIQLVIRADYDLQRELHRLQQETGAESLGQVIECGLHALDRLVRERNKGATIAFVQEDLEMDVFAPDYLYGKDSIDPRATWTRSAIAA